MAILEHIDCSVLLHNPWLDTPMDYWRMGNLLNFILHAQNTKWIPYTFANTCIAFVIILLAGSIDNHISIHRMKDAWSLRS